MHGRLRPLASLARTPSLRRCGIGFGLFSTAEYGPAELEAATAGEQPS